MSAIITTDSISEEIVAIMGDDFNVFNSYTIYYSFIVIIFNINY